MHVHEVHSRLQKAFKKAHTVAVALRAVAVTTVAAAAAAAVAVVVEHRQVDEVDAAACQRQEEHHCGQVKSAAAQVNQNQFAVMSQLPVATGLELSMCAWPADARRVAGPDAS